MGRFGKALQRFKKRLPKMDFIDHKHEDCANFNNGTCMAAPRMLNLKNLNPKGQACPHFKPKKIEEKTKKNN